MAMNSVSTIRGDDFSHQKDESGNKPLTEIPEIAAVTEVDLGIFMIFLGNC